MKRTLEHLSLALYSGLLWVAQPLLRWKLRKRGRSEPQYLLALDERFGRYGPQQVAHTDPEAGPLVWVHAVSLGETVAATALIHALRERVPGMRLLLTHGTATGREAGTALLTAGDTQVWQPWDTPGATQRFVQHFRPACGLLMETEVWPNLVAACRLHQIPLCLVNARMSEKSQRQTNRLGWLAGPAYRGLHAVWAQSVEDSKRLTSLGAPLPTVTGNVKFDAAPDEQLVRQGRIWRERCGQAVVMLASSREGEEALLLQVLAEQPGVGTGVQWLIVPRHPQRFDEVAGLLSAHGWNVSRRSEWVDGPPAATANTVWLGDSLGEMAMYFSMADAALLGGSFAPLGGQNLIEAAACGCPVVLGPHTFNFAQAVESSLAAGASFRVPDMGEAVRHSIALVHDKARCQSSGTAAVHRSQSHRGAVQRTVDEVVALLLR